MLFRLIVLALFAVQLAAAISAGTAKNALRIHNKYRAKHSAPALKWNKDLEKFAQSWANRCVFEHSHAQGQGENLAMGMKDFAGAIGAWYNEEKLYDYNNPGFSGATGHFTQVVWKSTTEVGCGVKSCPNGKMYVCSYKPPGNVVTPDNSYFKKNVLPK
ncbi:hypothetical protein LRAMOSA06858 [Lichtheimia ramosa]|uniref:SCP domain-containing protein n=1 Tax=Lichtheimia ramosa TaxID=688394 RepID=A0A077WCK1_9FUNG|nr:hypothetical protein LRAMOSA06858 [Lichtheimia ramosa]